MNFNDVQEKKPSPFLRPGSGLVLKINDIVLEKSRNNDSLRPVFFMESQPVDDPTFVPVDGAKGRVGKVSGNAGYYLKNDNQKQEFIGDLRTIAIALGKAEELKAIPDGTFEELVDTAKNILKGGFARYFVAGSEFPKAEDRYGIKLLFPNKNFVESIDSESKLEPFDKSNPKHYQALKKEKKTDDLPF